MYGYIYKTTNLINNKIYIGQHKYSEEHIDTAYLGSGKLICEAIDKYGRDNFKCEILEWCETEEDLSEKEIFYIKELKSTTDNGNYNISDGGYVPRFSGPRNYNYHRHWKVSEETKRQISNRLKGHKPTYTKPHTEETKRKIGLKSSYNNLHRDSSIYKKVSDSATGNKMMNKDGVCKRVHQDMFDEYLSSGWIFGGLSRKGKYKNRVYTKRKKCQSTLNKKLMNNGIISKFIKLDEIDNYIRLGWSLGNLKKD